MMIFSDRAPKTKKFGIDKKNIYKDFKKSKHKIYGQREIILRGAENFAHTKLREMQRYGTFSIKQKPIISSIKNGNAIILEHKDSAIIAVVRHSTRYYVVVYDWQIDKIKTVLPPNNDMIKHVQALIDKEISMSEEKAA